MYMHTFLDALSLLLFVDFCLRAVLAFGFVIFCAYMVNITNSSQQPNNILVIIVGEILIYSP